jgi:hypothetical protein
MSAVSLRFCEIPEMSRRIEDEEAFYAAYQAGVLLARSDWNRAVPALLEAWRLRPTRAEPLYRLAMGYRRHEQDHLARLFAERGLEISLPGDSLFVESDVYEWGLLFEWSIALARLGDLNRALEVNDWLVEQSISEEVLTYVRHNREWCRAQIGWTFPGVPAPSVHPRLPAASEPASPEAVPRLDELVPGMRAGEIRLEVEPAWPQLNPSIAVDGETSRMVVRTGSWTLDDEGIYRSLLGDGTVHTLNYLVELDSGHRMLRIGPVVDRSTGVTRFKSPVNGYEDCRLFKVGDRWFATATVRDQSPTFVCQMVLLAFAGNVIERVIPLPSPDPTRHEKNWMPVAAGGELHLIYSCDPTTVLRCDVTTGHLETIARHPAPSLAARFRGGSQGVAVDGGTLAVVHEVTTVDGRRRYTHRFVFFGPDYRIVGLSPRFCFASAEVEFCSGLARRNGELLMTFGIADRAGYLAVVDEPSVLALLGDPT